MCNGIAVDIGGGGVAARRSGDGKPLRRAGEAEDGKDWPLSASGARMARAISRCGLQTAEFRATGMVYRYGILPPDAAGILCAGLAPSHAKAGLDLGVGLVMR